MDSAYRPYTAIVLVGVGGLLILGTSWELTVGFASAARVGGLASWPFALSAAWASLGLVWGVVILVSACLLYLASQAHRTLGLLVILLAVASLFTDFGGLLLGAGLAAVGGAMAYVWRMTEDPTLFEEDEDLPSRTKV